jgi:hypothetical protein
MTCENCDKAEAVVKVAIDRIGVTKDACVARTVLCGRCFRNASHRLGVEIPADLVMDSVPNIFDE